MIEEQFGTVLAGNIEDARNAYEQWKAQPVDWDLSNGDSHPAPRKQRTIANPITVKGPGTFFGKSVRTVTFLPTDKEGWWFERTDLDEALPFLVSARNVWTTGDIVSNIVLRAGAPHNYVRMVEHIIALKVGTGIDNLLIRIDSGDPPLFKRGSLDLIEAIESAGVRELERPVRYYTVAKKVTGVSDHGGFVTLEPYDGETAGLVIDCAVDFKTAIGKQRIRFPVNREHFRYGAEARTNTTALKMLYCRTIGRIFADVRNLGYTKDNILIAGRGGYYNEPKLIHEGKSLEAVWHRAALDLLAAIALIEDGQFLGKITSYKAGHGLDVKLICRLYKQGLLVPVEL